jgi:hypothetical protein
MSGQVWATNSLGGYMYSLNLSKKLRHAVQPTVRFRQFCDVKDATQQGKSKGDTFHWNVYSNVATQGTTLVETTTMPETNFVITQGTLTITEFGKLFAALFSKLMNQFCTVVVSFNMTALA